MDAELKEYAGLLLKAGFRVYMPKGDTWNYFFYSREVDGKTCYGNVQRERLGRYEHLMPIKPSRKNGSSMFIDGAKDLTVEAAGLTARPVNRNNVVGQQHNYYNPADLESRYTELTEA